VHRDLSLAHLTVLSLPPPEMVRVAARTGYQAVGLRLIAVFSWIRCILIARAVC
jgi:hypothetical protein